MTQASLEGQLLAAGHIDLACQVHACAGQIPVTASTRRTLASSAAASERRRARRRDRTDPDLREALVDAFTAGEDTGPILAQIKEAAAPDERSD